MKMVKLTECILALMLITAFPAWTMGGKDDVSLKGMDIVIGNWWADFDVNTTKATNDAEEKLIEYRAKIQKQYGFQMRQKNIGSYTQMAQLAATSIMAGKPAAQVFVLEPAWALTLYNQKLLFPVSDSKAVNFKDSKPVEWNRGAIDSFTFNGKAYAFAIGHNTYHHANGVFFNKRLLMEAGINPNTPYDMQKAGTWTWNAFLDICKKLTRDKNNTGIINTYAMAADPSWDVLDAIIASNGARYVDRNASGKFVNATSRPEFLQALQFAIRLKTEGVLMPRPENANWDWYKPMFLDGKVAMLIGQQYVAKDLKDMKDDWGFVLFPKGPLVNDYRYSTDENVMVIPSIYSPAEVDKILYAVQLWETPIDNDPNAWKDEHYSIYRDIRAVDETLALIQKPQNGLINYHVYIPGLNRGDIAWAMWWWEGDPAQLIESVSQSWNTIISDANGIK
ncbi:MAG: extracellular solute-binding protein [Treponema sp.]|jgi:ABC-type glycerol-3-phosphate transport system substrate-binding protein|nr:extracellular solute-binding protein [Treponema sp.]